MIQIEDLPTINASLAGTTFVLLLLGRLMIMRKHVVAHKRFMLTALGTTTVFLISYVTYRVFGAEKTFGGQGPIRWFYYALLTSHVSLALTVPYLAGRTAYLALKGRFEKHRRLARLAWPIWVYVSATGVLVYLLLFRLYGPAADQVPG